jgi:hypothetical protein
MVLFAWLASGKGRWRKLIREKQKAEDGEWRMDGRDVLDGFNVGKSPLLT